MKAAEGEDDPPPEGVLAGLLRPHPAFVAAAGWKPLPALVAAATTIAAAPVAGDLAVAAYVRLAGLHEGMVIPGGFARQEAIANAVYFGAMQATFLTGALIAAAWSGHPAETLLLRAPAGGLRDYAYALLAAAVAAVGWLGSLWLIAPALFIAELRPNQEMFAAGPLWLTLAVFCLLAPVAEELLFRGLLFSTLSASRLGVAGAAVATSALWTALHVGHLPHAKAQVFAAGLFLSWLLVRAASVRVPIACHVLYNLALSLVLMAIPPLG